MFTTERCPSARGHRGPLILEMVGQASVVASVGMDVGLVEAVVVEMVVEVVVLEARMVHVRHMARMMRMVEVSQVTPAPEEPRLGAPNSVSPYSRTVPLHVMVLLSAVQADGQQQQQQQNGHSRACDQAHESRTPREA